MEQAVAVHFSLQVSDQGRDGVKRALLYLKESR